MFFRFTFPGCLQTATLPHLRWRIVENPREVPEPAGTSTATNSTTTAATSSSSKTHKTKNANSGGAKPKTEATVKEEKVASPDATATALQVVR